MPQSNSYIQIQVKFYCQDSWIIIPLAYERGKKAREKTNLFKQKLEITNKNHIFFSL